MVLQDIYLLSSLPTSMKGLYHLPIPTAVMLPRPELEVFSRDTDGATQWNVPSGARFWHSQSCGSSCHLIWSLPMVSIGKLRLWCPCELSVSPAAELVAVSQAACTNITEGLTLSPSISLYMSWVHNSLRGAGSPDPSTNFWCGQTRNYTGELIQSKFQVWFWDTAELTQAAAAWLPPFKAHSPCSSAGLASL